MTHYRLIVSLVLGVAFALLVTSCSGPTEQEPPESGGAARQPPQLAADAIGNADIGQPPQPVLEELNSFFGEPGVDSGWIDADSSQYGLCPGTAMRAIGWGSLYLFFVAEEAVTAETENVLGRLYSFSYGYDFSRSEGATDPRGLDLSTAEGIGLASPRMELERAFADRLVVEYEEPSDTWTWTVDRNEEAHLRGLLSGGEPDATVVLLESVPRCDIG